MDQVEKGISGFGPTEWQPENRMRSVPKGGGIPTKDVYIMKVNMKVPSRIAVPTFMIPNVFTDNDSASLNSNHPYYYVVLKVIFVKCNVANWEIL